jgi:hypothetical protein
VMSQRKMNAAVSEVDHGSAMAIATAHQSEYLLRACRSKAFIMSEWLG